MADILHHIQPNWRTGAIAGLVLLSLLLWGQELRGPVRHVNAEGGFSIEPPRTWTARVDDDVGSRITSRDGECWLIVNTRLTTAKDAMAALDEIAGRRAGGPISDVRWRRRQPVELPDGTPAALGELTQREERRVVHVWMLLAVRGGRLFHAVAAVPQDRAQEWEEPILASLASLRFE